MKCNSILYKILISFSCLVIVLLLCRNCSFKKQLNEQKQTIIKIDSILSLPPDTTIIRDTFFTIKKDTIIKEISLDFEENEISTSSNCENEFFMML